MLFLNPNLVQVWCWNQNLVQIEFSDHNLVWIRISGPDCPLLVSRWSLGLVCSQGICQASRIPRPVVHIGGTCCFLLAGWLIGWLLSGWLGASESLQERQSKVAFCRVCKLGFWMVGWLADWLARWLVGWLNGWLPDWLGWLLTGWAGGLEACDCDGWDSDRRISYTFELKRARHIYESTESTRTDLDPIGPHENPETIRTIWRVGFKFRLKRLFK